MSKLPTTMAEFSDASSFSSLASSSPSSDDRGKKRRSYRCRRDDKRRKNSRHDSAPSSTTVVRSFPPAPSDWDELRAHYQFVLPTDDEYGHAINAIGNSNDRQEAYGSTWQERMVQRYHAHLYKEYVLADLSRVVDMGKVGLRWRTEKEVADGTGFRYCGNLMCEGKTATLNGKTVTLNANEEYRDQKAYSSAARRHMGIMVPENGGKDPIGLVLPQTLDRLNNSLEVYLHSCAKERRKVQQQSKKRKSRKSKNRRKSHHRDKHSKDSGNYALKELERREERRLSQIPHGIGLHDYEVDFVYVEHMAKKRELVKVRLCLRCAPLLFAAKAKDAKKGGDGGSDWSKGPAVKAREARERAARSHASMTTATSDNNTMSNANNGLDQRRAGSS